MIRLPTNEQELLACGEWAKHLVIDCGGSPETAYKVSAEWVKGLRLLMEKSHEQLPRVPEDPQG